MRGRKRPKTRSRWAMAFVPALLFLALFGTLSIALYTGASLNARTSDNFDKAQSARFAAESGISWTLYCLRYAELPATTTQATLLDNLHTELSDSGLSVTRTAAGMEVAQVDLSHGSFVCAFELPDPPDGNDLRLAAIGTCEGATCRVAVTIDTERRRSRIFDYGIASKGKISVTGSAAITGMNNPGEANILSTKPELVAIEAGGSASIGGELFLVSVSKDSVDFTGKKVTVAGESDPLIILNDHVHLEVDPPAFPPVDVKPFQAMAKGDVITSSTDLSGSDLVLTNAVVEPNTNPIFTSNTTINGVLYVKSPNNISFTAGVTINGIIVTDNPDSPDLTANEISFGGNIAAPGVSALPDTEEFAEIKQHSGTILLAPGFKTSFSGGANSINGVIAADQLSFRGNPNVSGEINGSVIGLKDLPMSLSGNVELRINRDKMDPFPAGFLHPFAFCAIPDSYTEGVTGN